MFFPNGSKYVGEYKDGNQHGQGTYTYGEGQWEGDKYIGEYKDGLKHGQGTYTYGKGEWEGDKYVGEYKDDKRHGQGTFTMADGTVYKGLWKKDDLTVEKRIVIE